MGIVVNDAAWKYPIVSMFHHKNKVSQWDQSASSRARQALQCWYSRDLGQCLFAAEQRELEKVLPDLFGYHLLQVGSPVNEPLFGSSRVSHCVMLENRPLDKLDDGASPAHLWGSPTALPIASDSIDVVILPHTLEFEADPHQVLREMDRVLVAEGHVVILGFNPWGAWGLRRLLCSRWSGAPWNGQFRSLLRIKDWLGLLGYDTGVSRRFFFRPPLQHPAIMERLLFMERFGECWGTVPGAVYLLVAKKRMITYTPIKSRWRPRRQLVGAGLMKPTVNGIKG